MTDTPMTANDEAAIRGILAAEDQAWSRGDAAGFSQHLAENCIATNVQGQSMSGRDLFFRQHVMIFATFLKNTTLTQTLLTLRFIGDTAAIVESLCTVSGFTDPPATMPLDPAGRLQTRMLQVFEKAEGNWSIIAYHNTTVNQSAPPLVA
ncbi:MAG: SgcJ/EcaC family oxidoreductase [Dokdonella sp.]